MGAVPGRSTRSLDCAAMPVPNITCPRCGSAMAYSPPLRELPSIIGRLFIFFAAVGVMLVGELFGVVMPSWFLVGALAVAVTGYLWLDYSIQKDPGPGGFLCRKCPAVVHEGPASDSHG